MRKQTRPHAPAAFKENSAEWNKKWKALKTKNQSAQFSWYKFKGKSARDLALPILREMNQGHCSFCDCYPLQDRSPEPIEHFRPKSDPRFLDQAYTWENLFYCCEACNTSKLQKWDDGLIAPDEPTYFFDHFFSFDFTTGEIKPSLFATKKDRYRAQTTIEIFDLDSQARRRYRLEEARKFDDAIPIDSWAYRDFCEADPLFSATT